MKFSEFHKIRVQHVWDSLDGRSRELVEKDVEEKIAGYLSKWFTVYRQVKSDCKKFRCDILMYHKEEGSAQTPIIIEIKRDNVKQGQSLGEWCVQASDYSHTTWHSGKKALVIIFPQISGLYFEEGCLVKAHDVCNHEHHNINSFLYGAFKIGELRDFYYHEFKGYAIIANNKIIWQSHFPFQLKSHNLHKSLL